MKLEFGSSWCRFRARGLALDPFSLALILLFLVYHSPIALAQGGCAMEQHVVDSWTATVQADQDAIRQLEQSDNSRDLKLDQLTPLDAHLKNAVQHLQQAKARLADCQKKASGATPATPASQPAPPTHTVSLSNSKDAQWKIDGLGILTLGQPDPRSQRVAGTLLVQRNGMEGIPQNTLLTMDGFLEANGSGFKIRGSTLTKGSYLALKKKEDFAYEYRLRLEVQCDDLKTCDHLNGTASLVKAARYRDDKGTTIETFALNGAHSDMQQCSVISLTASSDRASNSPQAFAGGQPYPFSPSISVTQGGPGVHLVVFLNDVSTEGTADNPFMIQDFAVTVKANLTCAPKSKGEWKLTSGVANLVANQIDQDSIELRHLQKGGLYKITYDLHDGSIASEANIVLPLAGGEVKDLMARDIESANTFTQNFERDHTLYEQVAIFTGFSELSFGHWIWEKATLAHMGGWTYGNYRGRPDNKLNPTVWLYNSVSDNPSDIVNYRPAGLGAVATWYGVPVKVAKLSNFIVGYTVEKLKVKPSLQKWAQKLGTGNDASGDDSWKAGVDLADGRINLTDLKAVVIKLRNETEDKQKTVRLWPNPGALDNFKDPEHFTDIDRQFTHAGFLPTQ